MHLAETKAGRPIKAQGFRTMPWPVKAPTAPRRVVFAAENTNNETVKVFADWQATINHVKKHLPNGYAIARYFEPASDQWLIWKTWYAPAYKGKHFRTTDPRSFQVVMTTKPEPHISPVSASVAPSMKELKKLTCFNQVNHVKGHIPQPPTVHIVGRPRPKAVITQPGVGYYITTVAGTLLTTWRFTTYSAAKAYCTIKGFSL